MGRMLVMSLFLTVLFSPAMAQETGANAAPADQPAAAPTDFTFSKALAVMGACLAASLCALAGGWSISRIGGQCVDAMARQPEAAGAMFAPLVVTAAMVEGGMLFAIVVCLLGVLFL